MATQDRKLELKDVRYNSKVEKLTYLDINSWVDRQQPDFDVWGEKGHLVNVKMSLSALTHVYQKHKRWEYEGEVRSVLFAENDAENEKSGLLETMSNNAIEHVTIGSKMSSTNRKVILSLCKELGLPVYVASPNRYDYSVQIEYKDLNV